MLNCWTCVRRATSPKRELPLSVLIAVVFCIEVRLSERLVNKAKQTFMPSSTESSISAGSCPESS